jgi:hypothetical protein
MTSRIIFISFKMDFKTAVLEKRLGTNDLSQRVFDPQEKN